ncbi:MAG: histidinol-phosphatase [Rickettsiales bacterium]|nr:histidinol-phosphatase [Rickettsiales bacterium]
MNQAHPIVNPELIAFAEHLADQAGDIARRYFRQHVSTQQKADLSPVTQADQEIEKAIQDLIRFHYPEHGIIGEELGVHNPGAAWQWVIDPIDGTRSFIAGYPIFTTLIALTHQGIPLLGIIDQTINKERWVAVPGRPTLCKGNPVKTLTHTALSDVVIATTSTYYFNKKEAAAFETLRAQCSGTQLGGDAYGYAMVANGLLGLMVDTGLKPYDFCAIKPVIESAGGIITDWQGNSITLHSDGRIIAAANAKLHAQALTILQTAI